MACRVVGDCRYGGELDHEVGDLVSLAGTATTSTCAKQFSYLRYDPEVSRAGLDALGLGDIDPKAVQVMDSIDHIPLIQHVGSTYAAQVVRSEHWRGFV
jgi:uncharacterized protein